MRVTARGRTRARTALACRRSEPVRVSSLLLLVCLAGCTWQPKTSERMATAAAARAGGDSLASSAVRAHSAADTPWTVQRPDPRVGYGSFERACKEVERLVRGQFGDHADSARWLRGTIDFTYRDQLVLERSIHGVPYWIVTDRKDASRVPSLRVSLVSTSDNAPQAFGIADALVAAGWVEDGAYSADGADGTVFGYVCREALCRVEGHWDGGDVTDSLYVPAPGGSIELVCVPRVPAR